MLLAIGLLSTTFGVSIASALVPLISIEIFLVGIVLKAPGLPWWLLALVIAIGQITGKLLYFYGARGSLRLPGFLRRRTQRPHPPRWRERLDAFREGCRNRPVWTKAVLLGSAIVSLPPFFAIAALAGVMHVSLRTFLITGLVGRFLRFAALAVAPTALLGWMH